MELRFWGCVCIILLFLGCEDVSNSNTGEGSTYSITYNGNDNSGGNVPIDSTEYNTGDSVILADNTGNLIKAGYSWTGWSLEQNDLENVLQPGSSIDFASTDITVYAVWTEITYESKAFVFHDDESKLIEIDLDTGELTFLGDSISYGDNTRGAGINLNTNEYIGLVMDFTDGPYLVKINLETGVSSNVPLLDSDYSYSSGLSDFTITSEGNAYVFNDDENKLMQINIDSGELTMIGNGISYGDNTRGAGINLNTNEYIGLEMDSTDGPYLIKINLATGTARTVPLLDSDYNYAGGLSDFTIESMFISQ